MSVSSPEAAVGIPTKGERETAFVTSGPINVRTAHASDNAEVLTKFHTGVCSAQAQNALTMLWVEEQPRTVNLTSPNED